MGRRLGIMNAPQKRQRVRYKSRLPRVQSSSAAIKCADIEKVIAHLSRWREWLGVYRACGVSYRSAAVQLAAREKIEVSEACKKIDDMEKLLGLSLERL